MKSLMLEQFQEVNQTITDQKEELEEKFEKSTVKFAQKPLEKQFEINSNLLQTNHKIQKALRKKDFKKVKKLVKEQEEDLDKHEEDLLIADSSDHGWLTVSKIRDKKILNSSLVKKIHQVDALIEKAKNKNGGTSGANTRNPQSRQQFGSYGYQQGSSGQVVMKRPEKKSSPEELLQSIAKTTRAGQCSFCLEPGHWYRECPGFWGKVKESRTAWAPKPPVAAVVEAKSGP